MGITRTLRVISGAALTGALVLTSAPNATADDVRDKQWPLKSYDSDSIWKVTRGKGETVAVIDDGVNADHPDLKNNVLKGKDFIDGGSTAPDKGDDHGTAMASIIAGHGHGSGNADGVMGLAPESKILPIRDDASGPKGGAPSIRYAVDNGATVINISQAGGTASDQGEQEAISYALKNDVVVVAGTGNASGPVEYPAAYDGAVAVSGVQENGTLWPKSSYGPKTMLSAPGAKVMRAGDADDPNGYGFANGTSDATAYASAAAALVRAEHPDLSAGQVVNRLTETAELPSSAQGSELPDEQYGYGSIRPLAALREDIPKGSEYGPLSVPQSLKDDAAVAAKEKESDAQQAESDRQAVILWAITGVIGLLFIAAVVTVVLVVRRRKKKRSGGPGGYPYPPGQGPGYGMPPQQQQPMPPQPTAPPQQPPHN